MSIERKNSSISIVNKHEIYPEPPKKEEFGDSFWSFELTIPLEKVLAWWKESFGFIPSPAQLILFEKARENYILDLEDRILFKIDKITWRKKHNLPENYYLGEDRY